MFGKKSFLFLALIGVAAWFGLVELQQVSAMRDLVAVVGRLPEVEQLKPIACSRSPLAEGPEKAILQRTVTRLQQPDQRATAYCLLGDLPSALAAYKLAAAAGDEWAALQIYFLQALQGDMHAAQQALDGTRFSRDELHGFFSKVTFSKFAIDLLPVAMRTVELYPDDPESWHLWLTAAQVYEHNGNWQRAQESYIEAIHTQEVLGVHIGRGTFESALGRIYQSRTDPPDLQNALLYLDRAIAGMDFLLPTHASMAYMYRGEVYKALRPEYTVEQALQEFESSLALDPNNFRTIRAIANIYLWDLKNYPLAHDYINRAIGMFPDAPENYLIRGDIYRQQGDLASAEAAYKDALTRRPDWQVAVRRLAALQAELQKAVP